MTQPNIEQCYKCKKNRHRDEMGHVQMGFVRKWFCKDKRICQLVAKRRTYQKPTNKKSNGKQTIDRKL